MRGGSLGFLHELLTNFLSLFFVSRLPCLRLPTLASSLSRFAEKVRSWRHPFSIRFYCTHFDGVWLTRSILAPSWPCNVSRITTTLSESVKFVHGKMRLCVLGGCLWGWCQFGGWAVAFSDLLRQDSWPTARRRGCESSAAR